MIIAHAALARNVSRSENARKRLLKIAIQCNVQGNSWQYFLNQSCKSIVKCQRVMRCHMQSGSSEKRLQYTHLLTTLSLPHTHCKMLC